MIKTETRQINGREWSVTQWPGTRSLDIIVSLSKLLGGGLRELKSLSDKGETKALSGKGEIKGVGGLLDLDASVLAGVVDGILDKLGSSDDVLRLVFKLLSHTRIDGQPVNDAKVFDAVFAGPTIIDLAAGLRFVLETNFGDFRQAAGLFTDQSAADPKAEAEPI